MRKISLRKNNPKRFVVGSSFLSQATNRESRTVAPWGVALGSGLLLFMVAGIAFYGNAVYLVPLQKFFSIQRGRIAAALALVSLITGLSTPLAGYAVDRWGPRRCLIFGLAAIGVIFLGYSQMHTVWQLYLFVILQGAVQPFAGGIPNQSIVGRWFPERPGRPMGVISAGIGLGGLLLPWGIGSVIQSFGFRAGFAASGVLFLCLGLPVAVLLVQDRPTVFGQRIRSKPGAVAALGSSGTVEIGFRSAVKSLRFWLVLASASLAMSLVGILSFHFPAMLQDTGLDIRHSAFVFGSMLGLSTFGRVLAGELSSKIRPEKLLITGTLSMAGSAVLLYWLGTNVALTAFIVGFGVSQGITATLVPLVVQSMFGRVAFGRIYGAIGFGIAFLVACGNFVTGMIYDRTGSYVVPIALSIVLGGLSSLSALAAAVNNTRFIRSGQASTATDV